MDDIDIFIGMILDIYDIVVGSAYIVAFLFDLCVGIAEMAVHILSA